MEDNIKKIKKETALIVKIEDDTYYSRQSLLSPEYFNFGKDVTGKILDRCKKFNEGKAIWVRGSDLRNAINSFIKEY